MKTHFEISEDCKKALLKNGEFEEGGFWYWYDAYALIVYRHPVDNNGMTKRSDGVMHVSW